VILIYVNALPLLARAPRGMVWVDQYLSRGSGILTESFLFSFGILAIFSSLAAPPLVVAWTIREKVPRHLHRRVRRDHRHARGVALPSGLCGAAMR